MKCKDHDYLNRMTRWMADLDKIRDELVNYQQTVLAAHVDSISADLEFQALDFIDASQPEVTHKPFTMTLPRREV